MIEYFGQIDKLGEFMTKRYYIDYPTTGLFVGIIAKQLDYSRNKPENLREVLHPSYTISTENDQLCIFDFNPQTNEFVRVSDGFSFPVPSRKTIGQTVVIPKTVSRFAYSEWGDAILDYLQTNYPDNQLFLNRQQVLYLELYLQKLYQEKKQGKNKAPKTPADEDSSGEDERQ